MSDYEVMKNMLDKAKIRYSTDEWGNPTKDTKWWIEVGTATLDFNAKGELTDIYGD